MIYLGFTRLVVGNEQDPLVTFGLELEGWRVSVVGIDHFRKKLVGVFGWKLQRSFPVFTIDQSVGRVHQWPACYGKPVDIVNVRASLRRKRDFGIRIENLVRHPSFVEYLKLGRPSEGVVVYEPGEGGRWLSFNVVRTGDAERQLLIVRDVSREVRVESMRKDFVANASHELRSPLTVISGYLDALADDQKLDPTWNTPVLEMRRQAERMSTIINGLLELSKLESGDRRPDELAVDIGGMLALMRREINALERRPRRVTLRIESDAWLLGVEGEVHSIIANLVSNAVKYTPDNGEIELRWWTDTQGAHLAVRDTGVGIAAEHIPRLTERFYRVDSGRSRDLGGSGLGLAIVKHALQRHEGTLAVESREGQGSTFTANFPSHRIVPHADVHTAVAEQIG